MPFKGLLSSASFYKALVLLGILGAAIYFVYDLHQTNIELSNKNDTLLQEKGELSRTVAQQIQTLSDQQLIIDELKTSAEKAQLLLLEREDAITVLTTERDIARLELDEYLYGQQENSEEVNDWADDRVPAGLYKRLFNVPAEGDTPTGTNNQTGSSETVSPEATPSALPRANGAEG